MFEGPLGTKSKDQGSQQLTFDTMFMKASIYSISFALARERNRRLFRGVPIFDALVCRPP